MRRCARTTSPPGAAAGPQRLRLVLAGRRPPGHRRSASAWSTRPGQRYHPAIIAQAAATLGELFPGRFWLALGSGEASNEHITGDRWPAKAERRARLGECRGGHPGAAGRRDGQPRRAGHGRPGKAVDPPPSGRPRSSGRPSAPRRRAWVGGWADGLITINQPHDQLRADDRRVPRGRRRGQAAVPPGPPVLGGRRATRRWPSPTTSGAPTCSTRRWPWDLDPARAVRGRGRASCAPRTCAGGARLVRPGPPHRLAARVRRPRLRRASTCTRSARSTSSRSSTPSAPRSSRATSRAAPPAGGGVRHGEQGHQRPVVEERGHLLPRRRDVPRRQRRRDRRLRRADRAASTTWPAWASTCLWLMPFYPTPDRDDGYDISDFYGVDPRLGTLGDFVEFVRTARERGIRVIIDLVVNHTSDQHPWFQSARADRDSPYRDFYVWRDEQPDGPPRGGLPRRRGRATGRTTRTPGSGTCTASTRTSPTSTSPTRGSATRSTRSSASGCELGVAASGSTPCRS